MPNSKAQYQSVSLCKLCIIAFSQKNFPILPVPYTSNLDCIAETYIQKRNKLGYMTIKPQLQIPRDSHQSSLHLPYRTTYSLQLGSYFFICLLVIKDQPEKLGIYIFMKETTSNKNWLMVFKAAMQCRIFRFVLVKICCV